MRFSPLIEVYIQQVEYKYHILLVEYCQANRTESIKKLSQRIIPSVYKEKHGLTILNLRWMPRSQTEHCTLKK